MNSFAKVGSSVGCHTEIAGLIGNEKIDFNDLNEGIVYIEGGIGKS